MSCVPNIGTCSVAPPLWRMRAADLVEGANFASDQDQPPPSVVCAVAHHGRDDSLMKEEDRKFTQPEACGHCEHVAVMEVVATHSAVKAHEAETPENRFSPTISWDAGDVYELLKCPACEGVMLRSYWWHSEMDGEAPQRLYPPPERQLQGLPNAIQKALDTARKVKRIDANLFGVQLGRILEMVVHDQRAEGKSLHSRLEFLAAQQQIPDRLAQVASGLRKLRNIGAHATPGEELTPAELPIAEALCVALLEYLYAAPHLLAVVEQRLKDLKVKDPGQEP